MEETIVKPLMENQNSTSINLPESLIGLKEPQEVKSMHQMQYLSAFVEPCQQAWCFT
jgi:hypothetical protein